MSSHILQYARVISYLSGIGSIGLALAVKFWFSLPLLYGTAVFYCLFIVGLEFLILNIFLRSYFSHSNHAREDPGIRSLSRICFVFIAILFFSVLVVQILAYGIENISVYTMDTYPNLFLFSIFIPFILLCIFTPLAILPRIAQIICIIFVALWLTAETGFGIVESQKPKWTKSYIAKPHRIYAYRHPTIGTAPTPDNEALAIKLAGEEVVYRVVYKIDEFGRRQTPVSGATGRNRLILFFGGSNTFGEGLAQDETIPYFVGDILDDLRPYNYGFHGYGPAQMLDQLIAHDLRKEITEEAGWVLYVFMPFHIHRVIGSNNVSARFGRRFSHYVLDENKQLRRRGNFMSGRPMRTMIFKALYYSDLPILQHSPSLATFRL